MKRMAAIVILLIFTCTLAAESLKEEEYLTKPTKELKQLHNTNLVKGKELYNLKKFKESLPYLDKAIFFSNVLIKQAKLRKKAQDLLKEAKKWVDSAGQTVKENEKNRP